jgi:hypothetical protein
VNCASSNDLLHVTREDGVGPIEAREFRVSALYPSGKEAPHTILVVFDPVSHFYVWVLAWAPKNPTDPDPLEYSASRSAIAVGNGRIVWFRMGQPNLFVQESSRRAIDLDDAGRRSLGEVTLRLSFLEHYAARQDFEVEIGKELSTIGRNSSGNFFAPPNRVDPGPFPIHLEATYTAGEWEIILNAHLRARVLLGNRFQLVKVEQLKAPAP